MRFEEFFIVFLAFSWTRVQANPVQNDQKCGRKPVVSGDSVGENKSNSHALPWLVVFAHRVDGNRNFFCGGSLVSAKHVVSAAHCFQSKGQKKIRSPRDFLAFVGKHNLDVEDEVGSSVHKVWEVIVHEDWKYKRSDWDADIALIVLLTEVDLSHFGVVGIICLSPSSNSEFTGTGTISGWGFSEEFKKNRETFSSTPNEFELSAVSQSVCLDDEVSSNRTFCAGYKNQNKAACHGDSGSGFYHYERSTKRFNLAGIKSASMNDSSVDCAKNLHSIFTDVSKFTEWINNKMEETNEIKWEEVDFKCKLINDLE